MMGGMWLLCDDKGAQFYVRVEDIDEISLMDLLNDIHDESIKQGVHLPANFRIYYENPRIKQRLELYEDM